MSDESREADEYGSVIEEWDDRLLSTEVSISENDMLNLEVKRELMESLIRQRQINYQLKRVIDEMRSYKVVVESSIKHRQSAAKAFAQITWTDDLEEAHKIAGDALREIFQKDDDE